MTVMCELHLWDVMGWLRLGQFSPHSTITQSTAPTSAFHSFIHLFIHPPLFLLREPDVCSKFTGLSQAVRGLVPTNTLPACNAGKKNKKNTPSPSLFPHHAQKCGPFSVNAILTPESGVWGSQVVSNWAVFFLEKSIPRPLSVIRYFPY